MTDQYPSPLILTSNRMPHRDVDPTEAPRTDFDVLARSLGASILYPEAGAAPMAALEARIRFSVSQAVRARRRVAAAYVSLSERAGIPLSLLRPTAPHVMVAHLLTSASKRRVAQFTRFLKRTDVTLVFSRAQERYLRDEVGLDERQVRFVWDKVDQRFFTPASDVSEGDYVLSVGREQRDYGTLVEALRPLRLPCIIVAGSTWSHRVVTQLSLPDHIEMRQGLTFPELRALYQGARVVAVPIRSGIEYAAGVNGVLEAMACGRAVIASETPGLRGYVQDRVDGREVPAGDAAALRAAIEELWDDRAQACRLGAAARMTVERGRTIEHFVARIGDVLDAVA